MNMCTLPYILVEVRSLTTARAIDEMSGNNGSGRGWGSHLQ